MAEEKKVTMKTKNQCDICGYVKNVTLEEKEDKNGKDVMAGSIVLQYGANIEDQTEVKVYTYKLTAKNEVSQGYKSLVELRDNVVIHGKHTEENPPTIVRVYGGGDFTPEVKLNEYKKDGVLHLTPQISLGFGKIAIDKQTTDNFKGEFNMTIYLAKSPSMEKGKDGEETGRLVINGYYFTYKNEIKPIVFLVEEEDVISGMETLDKGETIEVWGRASVARITTFKETKSGFGGKARTDESTFTISELIVTGGEMVESEKLQIKADVVKTALAEREIFLDNLGTDKEDAPTPKKTGGFSKPVGEASSTPKKKSDIPF